MARCAWACAGGPDRWRVICCAAGGRHNLVLAMPDNSDSDRAARSHSNTVRCWPAISLALLCSACPLGSTMQTHEAGSCAIWEASRLQPTTRKIYLGSEF